MEMKKTTHFCMDTCMDHYYYYHWIYIDIYYYWTYYYTESVVVDVWSVDTYIQYHTSLLRSG